MTTKERAEQIAKQLMSTGNYQVVISEKTSANFPAKALLYLVENEPILCNELFDSLENNTTTVEGVNKPCKKYEIAGVKIPRFMLEKSIFDAISDGNVDQNRWVKDTTFLIEGKEFVVTNQWQGHENEETKNHRINDFAFLIYEFFQCRYFVNFNNGTIELCSLLKSNKMESNKSKSPKDDLSLQQIFYGAPGTGKSHKVKEVTETLPKSDVFRTTFHPDTDYSTFVGCYKPKMLKAPIRDSSGNEITSACEDEKKRIAYEYEPQAFLKAYVRAYETEEPVFLVIEEINRGNCAQIFGDMFQLLDRNENGESDYAIKPETAIQEFLCEKLQDCSIEDEAIKSGEEMKLPANLYIWATMNTSDQSLFPIDSAFKRRWDWKYMPIDTTKEQWTIKVNGKDYSWGSFLDQVNDEIGETTSSEDKKLGFYFCKASGTTIEAERFVSKVLFYIYNDVFKDYGLDSREFFKDKETGKVITFQSLFNMDGSVKEPQVEKILTNLGVFLLEGVVSKEAVSEELFHEEEPLLDEDGNEVGVNNSSRDNSRYSLNGDGKYKKGPLALAALESFVQSHTDLSADEVYSEWKSLNLVMPSHFIENENEYNSRISASNDKSGNKRCNPVTCGDGHVLYISTQWSLDSISVFIERVNAKDWGIHIEKTND